MTTGINVGSLKVGSGVNSDRYILNSLYVIVFLSNRYRMVLMEK